MAKKFDIKGNQVFEDRYGISLSAVAKPLFRVMADIVDQVDDGDYLEIEDKKVGYIELHFYEKEK
jgi:hypothetical protein